MSDRDAPAGGRELAHRIFAAEYDDADYSHTEGEEERAPTYVIVPSGAKANRLFFVGVLTEVEDVNENMLRARVVDPTGAFVVYAGQYQPDARTFFERTDPPEFVAVSGKARTFQPEGADRVFTSVRPESVNVVDADTRDRWVVDAAEHTLGRVADAARAMDRDGDPAHDQDSTSGIALAQSHYGTTPAYLSALRDLALDAAEVVAGDRDEVRPLRVDPDASGSADIDRLLSGTGSEHGAVDRAVAESGTADRDLESASEGRNAQDDAVSVSGESPPENRTESTDSMESTETVGSASTDPASTEPAPEDRAESPTDDDGGSLGDFEPGGLTGGDEADESSDGDDIEFGADADEMYELDEAERREVEQEYGTEFSTGTEVGDPGEAGIETPDSGEPTETAVDPGELGPGDTDPESEPAPEPEPEPPESESGTANDTGPEPDSESDPESELPESEPTAELDVDLVMARMRELDDGSGADRDELIDAVIDDAGADRSAVEDAIQDALMGGQCYEPEDDRLKPI